MAKRPNKLNNNRCRRRYCSPYIATLPFDNRKKKIKIVNGI